MSDLIPWCQYEDKCDGEDCHDCPDFIKNHKVNI